MTLHPTLRYSASMSDTIYEFRLEGTLDPRWTDWFEDLSIAFDPLANQTELRGTIPDQAALYGLIGKFRDLGLNLVSLARLAPTVEPPTVA